MSRRPEPNHSAPPAPHGRLRRVLLSGFNATAPDRIENVLFEQPAGGNRSSGWPPLDKGGGGIRDALKDATGAGFPTDREDSTQAPTTPAPARAPAPPKPASVNWTRQGNAFLWLVAKNGVAGINEPAVLLVGEFQTNGKTTVNGSHSRYWNVPGGGAEQRDNDTPLFTAIREFNEETQSDILLMLAALPSNRIHSVYSSRSGRTQYFMVHVADTAENISRQLRLRDHDKPRKTQMDARLQNGETQGWVWVTKSGLLVAAAQTQSDHPLVPIGGKLALVLRNAKSATWTVINRM